MRKLSSVLLSVCLCACANGPEAVRPSAPAATRFTRPDGPAEPEQVLPVRADWWRSYGSVELNALVERALRRNPGIEAAAANLRAAQANVAAQRGMFLPSVQLGLGASRQGSGSTLASPLANGSTPFNLHTAQLGISLVPDVFGANQRMVASLQAQANGQRYQLDAMRIALASDVVAAVVQLASVQAQQQTVEAMLAVAREQLAHQKRLSDAGYANGLDLASQEQALAQAEALLPPLRKQAEQTRDLLAMWCGDLPEQVLPNFQLSQLQSPDPLPAALPSQLLDQRPDVQAAMEQLDASQALVGVARAALLPQISLSAGMGFSGESLAGLLARGNLVWGVSAGLAQTLFSGGTLQARVQGAQAGADAALAQYRSAVLGAFQNVADALYALDADRQAWRSAQAAERASNTLLRLSQQQFEQGYLSGLALLGVRQAALQASLASVMAQGSYLADTVVLHQALGGGWQRAAVLAQQADH